MTVGRSFLCSIFLVATCSVATVVLPMSAEAKTYVVGPAGADGNEGTEAAPWATIQKAVNAAQPGDTIKLLPGRYRQDVRSARDGTPEAPITITGEADTIINGAGASPRVVEINHDNIVLKGFTIDGRHDESKDSKDSYRDKLLYVIGIKPGNGVEGLKVLGLTLRNAGGECMRMRYFAQRNEVANSTFTRCGIYDFGFKDGGKNGEGIYVGTAPEQLGKWGAPDKAVDHSNDNWIHHNVFDTRGNECVDIKEASSGNIVEFNQCRGQTDPNSGGFDSRGSGNIFRSNLVEGSKGAGIRLGGDSETDGINNDVYGNTFRNNAMGAVRVMRMPQGQVCGNVSEDNAGGDVSGAAGKGLDPTAPCTGADAAGHKAEAAPDDAAKASTTTASLDASVPRLACPRSPLACAVGLVQIEKEPRFKVLRASDAALNGKKLRLAPVTETQAGKAVNMKSLDGRVVLLEYSATRDGLMESVRVLSVIDGL